MTFATSLGRYLRRFAVPLVLVGSLLAVSPPAHAYEPGQASVTKLEWDYAYGGWRYTCNYSHWRGGAKVVTKCQLYGWTAGGGYSLLDNNGSSWTPPPASVSRSYKSRTAIGMGNICVRARAYSVDGGDDSGYQKCRFAL